MLVILLLLSQPQVSRVTAGNEVLLLLLRCLGAPSQVQEGATGKDRFFD